VLTSIRLPTRGIAAQTFGSLALGSRKYSRYEFVRLVQVAPFERSGNSAIAMERKARLYHTSYANARARKKRASDNEYKSSIN
jgi:hypothetical protein